MSLAGDKNILVIGDSCRDVFVYCNSTRLCPEAPVPALQVVNQTENGGMAKNVHRNISSLVNSVDILTNNNWYDITKVRYVHNATNHMFFRVDNDIEIKRINLNEIDFNYKIIVISDYNKGFLSEEDIATICKKHSCVFLDTKKIIGEWASSAKYIKINNFEYERSKEYITPNLDKKIIHTHGAEGCILNGQQYPVKKVNVIDVSGAGDSFLAGLVAKYLEDLNINESIMYANKCALKVVQERGVSVV
jgi:D-beta-D-heptose 7-phosphate kinase/D-beta-D-heptose 1-phosphate adenosyltransferase